MTANVSECAATSLELYGNLGGKGVLVEFLFFFNLMKMIFGASQVELVIKNLPAMQET